MSKGPFILPLDQLEPGHSRHQGRCEFRVLDAAGDEEAHEVDVVCDLDNYGGRIHVRGQVTGHARSHCHRCLGTFARRVEARFELVVQRGAESSPGDEVVGVPERAPELDLSPFVREAVILEEPIRQLCRPDCPGLCPQCGMNRNEGSCDCRPPADPRWDALKKLMDPMDS